MTFPSTWVMLKNIPQDLEVLESEGKEGNPIYSLVCENKKPCNNFIDLRNKDRVLNTIFLSFLLFGSIYILK
jgi:hypothetical protein